MRYAHIIFLLVPLVLAAGCAGLPLERRPSGTAEGAQGRVAESRGLELPGGEAPAGVPGVQTGAPAGPPPVRENPAVVALRDTAAEKSRAGPRGAAAAAPARAR
ncbi:MAG: hypothetical protein AB1578_22740, partial [Thermodesulfobacteriota bacterium]